MFRIIALILVLAGASCSTSLQPMPVQRVLFVGNSLVYYGNVPAIYSAIAKTNDKKVESYMIVQPGGTLRERVEDGSVARALATNHYTHLVLQERGGDLLCAFGPESCPRSRQAIETLARLAGKYGARAVLLGTYQTSRRASQELVEAESRAARNAGIPYIEVSETFRLLRQQTTGFSWFASDGAHPGKDLSLLNAILVYRTLQGSLPRPTPLTVTAPIYVDNSHLTPTLRHANSPASHPSNRFGASYSLKAVKKMLNRIKSVAVPPPLSLRGCGAAVAIS